MFEAMFSFRGRLNRLQYFLRTLAVGPGLIVTGLVVLVFGAAMLHGGGNARTVLLIVLAVLITIPIFLWSGLSLQARRFRDIGWDPVLVIPAWMAVMVFDSLLARAVHSLAIDPLRTHTWAGLLINLAFSGALLFWPSAEDAGDAAEPPASGWSLTPAPSSPGPTAPAASALSPARAAAAPGTFGRRGL